jgi:taurine dioxygenase
MKGQITDVLLERDEQVSFETKPISRALGMEVLGLDVSRPISRDAIAKLRTLLAQNCLLLFRNQRLTPEQHISFSRNFGELQPHILKDFNMGGYPELFVISNIKEDGKAIGRAGAGQYWHTDVSYVEEPALGSIMYAIEVPTTGGDTMFANMYKAYAALSELFRRLLEGLEAEHDFAHSQVTYIAKKNYSRTATSAEITSVPPVLQPVVRMHPESRWPALYVNPGFTTRILELEPDESRAVLDFLFSHSTKPEFVYRHRWQVGDVVFWDNRSSMHCAIDDYGPSDRRHMVRTTIKGARCLAHQL